MIIFLTPFNAKVAARQRDLHFPASAPQARRGNRGRTRRRTAGLGQSGATFPGTNDDVIARYNLRQRDVGTFGKDRMIFQQRPESR